VVRKHSVIRLVIQQIVFEIKTRGVVDVGGKITNAAFVPCDPRDQTVKGYKNHPRGRATESVVSVDVAKAVNGVNSV